MQFHHVGCVVQSIEEYLRLCIDPLGFAEISELYDVPSQRVKVCFVKLAGAMFLELVEPTAPDSPVQSLRQRGGGYYHTCFLVDDIETTASELSKQGFLRREIFIAGGFGSRRCCFLLNPFGHLVELAERLYPSETGEVATHARVRAS